MNWCFKTNKREYHIVSSYYYRVARHVDSPNEWVYNSAINELIIGAMDYINLCTALLRCYILQVSTCAAVLL
jgi:hypothetical protein